MAGGEAFTILAILEARDRISSVMEHVDATLDGFAATANRAAESARVAGQAMDQSFLQTASGADAAEVATARVSAARAQLTIATQEQAAAERELLTAQTNAMAAAPGDAAAMDRQAAAAQRMATAEREAAVAARGLRDAQATQAATMAATTGATSAAATSTAALGSSVGGASNVMKTATKTMMGVGLVAAGIAYESIKAATSFQTLTTRLVTSAGESAANLELVRRGILNISSSVALSADEVAQSMYVVESAGYHGAAGLDVLKAATEGAKIEGADFTTVANAVTDVLKDYHYSADKAGLATSQLIKAVSYGKTNFQNLSSAMNNILPFAASLHLKLEDVVGVLAEMTAHGVTAQRASQNIANAMRSLAAPSNVMSKEFDKLGISAHEVQNKLGKDGLAATMQWLSQVAKEEGPKAGQTYNEALKKLMGTAAGFNVALMSTGENAKDVNAAIKGIGEASTEANGDVEGFGATQDTFAYKMDKIKVSIHNAGIEIGTALLPAVSQLADWIGRIVAPIATWISHHQKLTAVILGAAIAMGILAAAISIITAIVTILFSEVGLVVLAIIALGVALAYAYTHSKTFRDIVQATGTALKIAWNDTLKAAAATIDWFDTTVLPKITAAIGAVINWFKDHGKEFSDAWNAIVKEVDADAKWFNDNVIKFIEDRISQLVQWFKDHGKEIEQVWKAIWLVLKTSAQAFFDATFKPFLTVTKAIWITAWDAMRDGAKVAWAVISGSIKLFMTTILGVIGIILDLITGHWGKAWKDVKKLVTDSLKIIISTIKNVTSGFGTLLYDAGKNIIKGLINGIKSMIGSVKSAVSGVVSTIKNHMPWSPAKEGPLSGSGAPEIGGANIVKLMAKGILSGKSQVTAAMAQVTGAASQQLTNRGGVLGTVGPLNAGTSLSGLTRGGAGNVVVIQNDFKGAQIIGEQAMDQLADRVGRRVATRILPSGGVRIRM